MQFLLFFFKHLVSLVLVDVVALGPPVAFVGPSVVLVALGPSVAQPHEAHTAMLPKNPTTTKYCDLSGDKMRFVLEIDCDLSGDI